MHFSLRQLFVMACATLAIVGLGLSPAAAQGPLNPYAGLGAASWAAGGVPTAGGWGGGWGGGTPYSSLINSAAGYNGLGGLGGIGGLYGGMGGGMYPPGGIYGNYSPFLPYQYGALTNPYTGFLSGMASITTANGQFEVLDQQAKSLRQDNIRKVIENRRLQDEADYERWQRRRGNIERDRQHDQAVALDRARHQPPPAEVWSGSSLNTLLRNLIAQQKQGNKGRKIEIPPETLRSVNLTTGSSRANPGLLRSLREKRKLSWPLPLQDALFSEARDRIDADLDRAVGALKGGQEVDPGTIKDLRGNLQALYNQLRASVGDMTPQQYVEAKRYLSQVGDALAALDDPNIPAMFNQKWMDDADSVGKLVKFMEKNGLQFAPAVPGDEGAYTNLYHALAAYDSSMEPAVASNDGPPPPEPKK